MGFIVGIFVTSEVMHLFFCVLVCAEGRVEAHFHPVLTLSDSSMMSFGPIWSQTVRPFKTL